MKNKISEAIARVEEKYLKEYVADEQEMRDLFKIDMKNTWFTWWIDVFKQELLKAYKAGDEAHTATLLQRVEEMREDEDICGSGIHNKAIDSVLEAIKQPKEK